MIIIDENLPAGAAVNTAAVMAVSVGKAMPRAIGDAVRDRDGNAHRGIIKFPIPVLKTNSTAIKAIKEKLSQEKFADVISVDFTTLAQSCKTYEEYTQLMAGTRKTDLCYIGIALCGPKKAVNSLSGNLPLFR